MAATRCCPRAPCVLVGTAVVRSPTGPDVLRRNKPRVRCVWSGMTQAQIRLWPGVVAAVVGALIWLGAPLVSGEPLAGLVAVLGGFVAALSIVVWWAFFSRAPRSSPTSRGTLDLDKRR